MDSGLDIEGPENQSKHKSQSRVVMNQLTCLSILLAHFRLAHENELHAVANRMVDGSSRFWECPFPITNSAGFPDL